MLPAICPKSTRFVCKRFAAVAAYRACQVGRLRSYSWLVQLPEQSAVYYPEELSFLGQILDQAVQSLPLNMRTPQNRAAVAKNILACAATGERDPIELRLAALINLKVPVTA